MGRTKNETQYSPDNSWNDRLLSVSLYSGNYLENLTWCLGCMTKKAKTFPGIQVEDPQTMQPFIDYLDQWGCQVLRAVNRQNPYRGGFSILFRSDDATARAIGDLGIAQILLDVRVDTYLLRLPEVNIDSTPGPHPTPLPWNEVTKRHKLDELLALWENAGDILGRRRQRLGMFYKNENG